jgi:FkbM family methyltransferase
LSYQKILIQLLDRPGGRLILGKAATLLMRGDNTRDIEIKCIDGFWTRRVGDEFILDGPRYEYVFSDLATWRRPLDQYVEDTKEYWLQHYTPQKGDVIVDVGAGRGEDTLTFSRAVGPTGRVIAIEAHPQSFAMLKSFCRLNKLSNVTAVHVALMDKPGSVEMAEAESSWQENAIRADRRMSGVVVPAVTLDDLCERQHIKNISFLKMNIEGAEVQALKGMKATMARIRQICVACHDFRADVGHGEELRTRSYVERSLQGYGFTIASRQDDERDYVRDHVFGLRIGQG